MAEISTSWPCKVIKFKGIWNNKVHSFIHASQRKTAKKNRLFLKYPKTSSAEESLRPAWNNIYFWDDLQLFSKLSLRIHGLFKVYFYRVYFS